MNRHLLLVMFCLSALLSLPSCRDGVCNGCEPCEDTHMEHCDPCGRTSYHDVYDEEEEEEEEDDGYYNDGTY